MSLSMRFVLICFFIIHLFQANAWTKCDYTTTYDSDFNKIIKVPFYNSSYKTVTNILFKINIKRPTNGTVGMWDSRRYRSISINETVEIFSSKKGYVYIYPDIPEGWVITEVGIDKVRYSDGTIQLF